MIAQYVQRVISFASKYGEFVYIATDHAYFIKLSSILQGENDGEKIYQSGVLSRLILKHTISQQRMWKTF